MAGPIDGPAIGRDDDDDDDEAASAGLAPLVMASTAARAESSARESMRTPFLANAHLYDVCEADGRDEDVVGA